MHRLFRLFVLILLVAGPCSPPSFATDGDTCKAEDTGLGCLPAGIATDARGTIVLLCDAKTIAGACNAGAGIRLNANKSRGRVTYSILQATTCSVVTVSFTWSALLTGGVLDPLPFTLTLANASVTIESGAGFPAGFIFPTIDTATGCAAGGLTVVSHSE